MLARLQRPKIADDGPTVAHRNLRLVGRHRTVALGDHRKQMADRRAPQPLDVIGRRGRVAPLHDLALARAQRIVANHAIDHVAIAAVLQNGFRHRKGKLIDKLIVAGLAGFFFRGRAGRRLDDRRCVGAEWLAVLSRPPSGQQRNVRLQVPAGHRAGHRRSLRAIVGKELARLKLLVTGLVGHFLLAARDCRKNQ